MPLPRAYKIKLPVGSRRGAAGCLEGLVGAVTFGERSMEERNRILGETLKGLLAEGKMGAALALLDGLYPADAAEVLESLPYEERLRIFRSWDAGDSSEALLEMAEDEQVRVVEGLARNLAVRIISEMPPDDAVDLLADLPSQLRESILSGLSSRKAGELRRLLAHGERTAGGLMTPEAMRLSQDLTVGEVLEKLREAPESVEMIYYIYLLDDRERLVGVTSLRELIVADPGEPVSSIMHRDLISVGPGEDQEKVAALIDRYDLLAVPVVDGEGRLLGIVTVDDVLDVIEEEAQEDIYSLVGSWETEEGAERHPLLAPFLGRLPWVFIALALEVLVAGGILRGFSEVLRDHLAIIFFIPAILAMGGTVALQSATRVTVELLQEGEGGRYARAVAGEAGIGLLVAAASGGIIAVVAWLMRENASLGAAVGLAMACAVISAALLGSSLPLLLSKAGRDPSKASEPLVATLMDIVGLAVYLLVAMALV